jgi:ribonuclease HI
MKKKYYGYFVPKTKKSGVAEDWKKVEKLVKGVAGARYRSFDSKEEAAEWLKAGANYEIKESRPSTGRQTLKKPLESGVYFDAGTGRGKGVEVNVTDEKGKSLLSILEKKISKQGTIFLPEGSTNNYGELLACKYALKIALKTGVKKVFGDSKLVIEFWSSGFAKRSALPVETIALVDEVADLRDSFEDIGGKIERVSGDDNPADLGFHK